MRALKALVVFMGVLIAVGLGLLTYAVIGGLPFDRSSGSGDMQPGGFGDTTVVLPSGCVIAEAVVAEGTLVLRIDGPAERGCQLVILLDPESGRELGRVEVQERP
ncbi:MAG: hypothetical protein ACTSW2_05100 [Alphaproteobacteria bacterium]